MTRRLQLSAVLLAWLLATGSHWDLVQTVAWGRMIGNYARDMSMVEAIRLTFTSGKLCRMCEAVQEAKQQQSDATVPGGKLDGKVLLVFQPAPHVVIDVPALERWVPADDTWSGRGRASPPVPPPRELRA
ncbi:MAG TPA: hypothetical protein VGD81_18805 [Opitutaceae bacterium]